MQETVVDLELPFLKDLSDGFREALFNEGEVSEKKKGDKVTIQYDLGTYFYLLQEGEVVFSIKIEDEFDELGVGSSSRKNTPIGWSGFREPNRYATTVTCSKPSRFIKWKHEDLKRMMDECPSSGMVFMKYIVHQSQLMLQGSRSTLAQSVPDYGNTFLDLVPFQIVSTSAGKNSLETLKKSPFFEIFNEEQLELFFSKSEEVEYKRGEKIYNQFDSSDSFYILVSGKVALVYSNNTNDNKLDKTIIDNEGYIIGCGCYTEDSLNHVSCVSLSNTVALEFNQKELEECLIADPKLGLQYYKRLLWFISTRLRSARAKLIALNYDGEIGAVKNLIEQNCTLLDILSPLHKIPHLLKSTFTLNDAITQLENISLTGSNLEMSLAKNSLRILSEVIRENDFYSGLAGIYSKVVHAPDKMSHREVRDYCAEQFCDVFEGTNYVLSGEENLLDEASIFIYNHLENHIYNTFPNNFQLTLDSHFISSVVLYQKYKNPGIRVVRVPRGEEYGHQFYYNKLGHIPVYTKDSAVIEETPVEAKARREVFYKTASDYLKGGTSIMLAPEGQSFSTGVSPGEFKPGAFYLTTKMEKEPYITPIAVANFDKRLNRTTFSAVIKKPFKLSDRVENPKDRKEMSDFLLKYKVEYRSYVEEALDLSRGSQWMEIIK